MAISESSNDSNKPGVLGTNTAEGGAGVFGRAEAKGAGGVIGCHAHAVDGRRVYGESEKGTGVWGYSKAGAGVVGGSEQGLAGSFQGNVEVTGDIRLTNSDCAEDFDIANADLVEPGTVMVLGSDGALRPSESAYDKRVAGVVSGAGNYKPGIVLDKQESQPNRKPIALLGKVFCKVDPSYAPVEIGDLLTTSTTPGHAMKATEQGKALGAVIGKALRPLSEGQGLIPILIALQ
jgi:hypothetical protein